jgi:hypothetical protein
VGVPGTVLSPRPHRAERGAAPDADAPALPTARGPDGVEDVRFDEDGSLAHWTVVGIAVYLVLLFDVLYALLR